MADQKAITRLVREIDRLVESLRFAMTAGKKHNEGCACVDCEDARARAHFDGGEGR